MPLSSELIEAETNSMWPSSSVAMFEIRSYGRSLRHLDLQAIDPEKHGSLLGRLCPDTHTYTPEVNGGILLYHHQ
jgi:hypothetical protein